MRHGAIDRIAAQSRRSDKPFTLETNKNTRDIIKQDSVASIQTEGLLGNQYVAISFGSPGKPDVKDGDTIASVPPLEMAAILEKADVLLDSGKVAMANMTQITAHLNSVSSKIDSGNGTVGALVNDKALYNNIDQTASTAKTAVSVSAQKAHLGGFSGKHGSHEA